MRVVADPSQMIRTLSIPRGMRWTNPWQEASQTPPRTGDTVRGTTMSNPWLLTWKPWLFGLTGVRSAPYNSWSRKRRAFDKYACIGEAFVSTLTKMLARSVVSTSLRQATRCRHIICKAPGARRAVRMRALSLSLSLSLSVSCMFTLPGEHTCNNVEIT